MEVQLRAAVLEEEDTEESKKFVKPNEMPQKVIPYKNCMIEDYGGYYLVMKPSGEMYEKVYHNINLAMRDIDMIYPLIEKPKPRRSKVHNIRFVR